MLRRDLEARAAELADARASRDAAAAAADAAARFAQSGVGAALAEHEAALAALSREHAAALQQQQVRLMAPGGVRQSLTHAGAAASRCATEMPPL